MDIVESGYDFYLYLYISLANFKKSMLLNVSYNIYSPKNKINGIYSSFTSVCTTTSLHFDLMRKSFADNFNKVTIVQFIKFYID